MNYFLGRWAVTAVSVLAAAHVVAGVSYESYGALAVAALVLGAANAVIKPVLMLLTLPFLILTLGLFTLFINAFLFWLAGWLVKGFNVEGFLAAFLGALIVSVVSFCLNGLVWSRGGVRVYRGRSDVIDV